MLACEGGVGGNGRRGGERRGGRGRGKGGYSVVACLSHLKN